MDIFILIVSNSNIFNFLQFFPSVRDNTEFYIVLGVLNLYKHLYMTSYLSGLLLKYMYTIKLYLSDIYFHYKV